VNHELAKCPVEDEYSEAEKPLDKGNPRPFKR